jgi:hypothetical protein
MQNKSTRFYWTIVLFSVFSMAGCMESYGSLRPNPDVEKTFYDKKQLPDFNYYYNGRSNLPYAVIGIHKDYNFNDRVWIRIEDHSDVYDKIGHILHSPKSGYNKIGSDILDPSGNVVGVWFSYFRRTVVKIYPDMRIDVFSPYIPSGRR